MKDENAEYANKVRAALEKAEIERDAIAERLAAETQERLQLQIALAAAGEERRADSANNCGQPMKQPHDGTQEE